MSHSVAILIIVHRDRPSAFERQSLQQCREVLGAYPMVLVCPEGMDTRAYKTIAPALKIEYIHPKWQASYAMFNRLKIAPLLYEKYQAYEYILFYELDAWVFKNELEYWCNQGYDYIGAPWFEGWDKATSESKFVGVGNGGFSLRKVQSHLKVLNTFSYITKPWQHIKHFLVKPTPKRLRTAVLNSTVRNNTHKSFNDWSYQEDHFWGLVVTKNFKWFKVPDKQTALRFSVEVNPQAFIRSPQDLPFGCHAWFKYQPEFWKQYIPFPEDVLS